MRALVWFREHDLRLYDNTALYQAAKNSGESLIACFFITPDTWLTHDMAGCRVEFMLHGLNAIRTDLASLNIPLLINDVGDYEHIPERLRRLCKQHRIQAVFCNQQYEPNEMQRDQAALHALIEQGISFHTFHDSLIIPPDVIESKDCKPYTVFTPYKRRWIAHLLQEGLPTVHPKPQKRSASSVNSDEIPALPLVFRHSIPMENWPAGEKAAQKRLQQFMDRSLIGYHEKRDFPGLDSTSQLSPYLATGMISIRHCLHAAVAANQGILDGGHQGIITWINELIWREFYKMILVRFPRVGKHKAFQEKTDGLPWQNNPAILNAWQAGQTGFPIVDAAMRQLNQTGWMHNRSRMIVAMFLTKLCHIDWRLGERYFMQQLIDGDLAANNGGWQWSSSTGTDATPYFRIFNPAIQSERFDPEGYYIKMYCPELQPFNKKEIHQPFEKNPELCKKMNYPRPIIDYKTARQTTLAMFKSI